MKDERIEKAQKENNELIKGMKEVKEGIENIDNETEEEYFNIELAYAYLEDENQNLRKNVARLEIERRLQDAKIEKLRKKNKKLLKVIKIMAGQD